LIEHHFAAKRGFDGKTDALFNRPQDERFELVVDKPPNLAGNTYIGAPVQLRGAVVCIEMRDTETRNRIERREDRRLRSFSESSAAEVVILAALHVGGEIGPNPASLAIDDALLLKLADSHLPALNRSRMAWIFGQLLIPNLRDWNRLHYFMLPRMSQAQLFGQTVAS